MFKREITSFGKSNLKTLRKFGNVKSISQLRKRYPNRSDDAIYLKLANDYNDEVDNRKLQAKEYKKVNSNYSKSVFTLPFETTTKKSREERILSKISKEKVNGNETIKELKNYNRKGLKSALNGTYEDVEFDYVTNKNMNHIIYDTILKKFSKTSPKPKREHICCFSNEANNYRRYNDI